MTPDDMEGRLAKLAAMTTVDPIMLDAYGRCSATFGDLRALLLDYQARGRALERIAGAEVDGLDLARDSMVLTRAVKIARATLKGKSQ
jgi:hypothetical protein